MRLVSLIHLSALLVLLGFTVVVRPVVGHGDHDEHPEETLDQITRFLNSSFVQLDTEQTSPRPFVYTGANGEKYYIPRARVTHALIKAWEALAETLEENPHVEEMPPWGTINPDAAAWKFWTTAAWRLYPLWNSQTRAAWREKLRRKKDWFLNLPTNVKTFVKELPSTVRSGWGAALGGAAEMAGTFGVLPVLLIVAPTFPVWTVATEAIESVFMGPAHWACPLFFYVYVAGVTASFVSFQTLSEIAFYSGSSHGPWRRFRQQMKASKLRRRFRKLMKSILLESENAPVTKKEYLKRIAHFHDQLPKILSESDMWSDFYNSSSQGGKNYLTSERPEIFSPHGDIGYIFLARQQERQLGELSASELSYARLTELFTGVSVIIQLIRVQLKTAFDLHKLTVKQYRKLKLYLGRFQKQVWKLQRGIVFALEEDIRRQQQELVFWAQASYNDLMSGLRILGSAVENPEAALAKLPAQYETTNKGVNAYRRNDTAFCRDKLEQQLSQSSLDERDAI